MGAESKLSAAAPGAAAPVPLPPPPPDYARAAAQSRHGPPLAPRRASRAAWDPVLDACARFFATFCHTLGAAFLRALSTAVLVCGVVGAVVLHMVGYYYLGALNVHPLVAAALYLPALAALSLLREEVLEHGTSPSGAGPARVSHAVALAYLVLIASAAASVVQPVWLRGADRISARSMWTCVGATAWLYFSLLFSSLAHAAALNIFRAGRAGRAGRRAQRERRGGGGGHAAAWYDEEVGGAGGGAAPDLAPDAPAPAGESGPYDGPAAAAVGAAAGGGAIDSYYKVKRGGRVARRPDRGRRCLGSVPSGLRGGGRRPAGAPCARRSPAGLAAPAAAP